MWRRRAWGALPLAVGGGLLRALPGASDRRAQGALPGEGSAHGLNQVSGPENRLGSLVQP